jgi:hypothetical protein
VAAAVVTPTINRKTVWGDRRVHFVTLAVDTGDYAAGGIPVSATNVGLNSLENVLFQGAMIDVAATPTALIPRWNAGKIQLFEAATAGASFTEKPAEAMGAGCTVDVIAIGY